ncbi:MAG: GIY-YIG nuclease family protein [Candidatus Tyrphobacter sp.]
MNEKPSPFADIFSKGDPHGLFAQRSAATSKSTEDEIAVGQFEAINAFIDEHHVLPGSAENGRQPNLNEYTLEAHLETFRNSEVFRASLAPYDRHGLLGGAVAAPPSSMKELIEQDHPLLHDPSEHIFDLRHVASPAEAKSSPDEVAKRRPCENFADYEPIFDALRADLGNRRRVTKRFEREGSIVPGATFILNGIMAYVADVSAPHRRGKEPDARIRVIFDNGMESNHLLRSFARVLYEDDNGRQIIESAPVVSGPLFTGEAEHGNSDEKMAGTIYVVESQSTDPGITSLRGRLYKIGFTTRPVDERLADVEKDPTFLLAPVRKVATFETNVNPQKLEALVHLFFTHARLQVDVLLGRPVTPREWFVVPLDLIREAIHRIIDGTIVNYRYDHISRKIVPR